MKLCAWSRTDTGLRRDHNEDSLLADLEIGLFAVADGMGGHRGGARASQLALEVLAREVGAARRAASEGGTSASGRAETGQVARIEDADTEVQEVDEDDGTVPVSEAPEEDVSLIERAARKASRAVFAAAHGDPELKGMGTTLTAMLHDGERMHLVHAGDSRAYLLRDGRLRQLTEDHSWVSEQVKAGIMSEAEAQISELRHVITRSIGFERDVELDAAGVVVHAGDCFLLCSDGMSNYVEGDELEHIMTTAWYRQLPDLLVDLANERGGADNITVVVVYCANDLTR